MIVIRKALYETLKHNHITYLFKVKKIKKFIFAKCAINVDVFYND